MNKRKIILKILTELGTSFLPLLFWAAIMFGFDAPYFAILTIISAIIHEMGHICTILILSGETSAVSARIIGIKISKKRIDSYKNEILILLFGPMANIVLGLVVLSISFGRSEYLMLFALINIFSGVSNLLPLDGYDGFNILVWIFEEHGKYRYIRILRSFSFIISVLLTFISLYLVYILNTGYWIFLLFFVSMMNNIAKKTNVYHINTFCENS